MIIGNMRPSQLITTFGPGSIVNLEDDTVMILGLDFWPQDHEETYFRKVSHPYLSRQLAKDHFQMPISGTEQSDVGRSVVPCITFPRWKICQSCRRLQQHAHPINSKFSCRYCDSKIPLFRVTFVQICDNGHIQEFPWEKWVHSGKNADKNVDESCTRSMNEELKLVYMESHKGTSLSNLSVKCLYCGAFNTMKGATDKGTFKQFGLTKCYGKQPWLDKIDPKSCNAPIYGTAVSSSSIYYPSVVTSLLIPNWIHDVDEKLNEDGGDNASAIRNAINVNKISYDDVINFYAGSIFKDLLKRYSKNEIIDRLKLRFDSADPDISTEGKSLEQEFDAFSTITNRTIKPKTGDIKIDIEPINITNSRLNEYGVDTLMKFHRLVSIQVLRGFTRGSPPDIFAPENQIMERFCPIGSKDRVDPNTRESKLINWLPATETRGEGLFIKFDERYLLEWEQQHAVQNRCSAIVESHAENADAQNRSKKENIIKQFNMPRFLLLHTVSHLLIREIALYAGYDEASLRERVYATTDDKRRNGILIYTSSLSSEGSLGGLVRLGGLNNFEEIIEEAIKKSNTCSRDPLCGEFDPTSFRKRGITTNIQSSGSSCYSCTLLPETSCQYFNTLLDRWMLQDPNHGFFKNQIQP